MIEREAITVEVSLDLNLDGIECDFEYESAEYDAEPYSWGESRGKETEISNVRLITMYLGDDRYPIDRTAAAAIFGETAIQTIENVALNSVPYD